MRSLIDNFCSAVMTASLLQTPESPLAGTVIMIEIVSGCAMMALAATC